MTADTSRTVRPSDATTLISHCMKKNRPVFLWGAPGIGKSELVETIGNEWNRPHDLAEDQPNPNARPIIDMRLLLMDPTDIKGIPYFDSNEGAMKWAPSSELPQDGQGLDNAILFLDEMNSAPPSVQGAAYQLILNRRVGEYVLPDGVSIIAAGNRDTDKGVTFRMPTPLANRFVHLEMTHNFDDWQKWAVTSGVHPDVVGFLSHHRQKLFNFDPKSGDKSFATPRTWTFVSDLLDDNLPDSINSHLVAGTVGEGIAVEFMAHRRVASKMPNPMDILMGKVKKLETDEISAKFSLTVSMCYALKELQKRYEDTADTKFDRKEWNDCVDNFFEFMLENFEAEMSILGTKQALSYYKLPINHRELKNFTTFYQKYGKYVLD